MANCLIDNDLPKVINDIPSGQEEIIAFFENYKILANEKEMICDSALYEGGWYIYFVAKDEDLEGQVVLYMTLPEKQVEINGSEGYFEPLTSFSVCAPSKETPICDEDKEGLVINPTSSETEYIGTSGDDKPTNVPENSIYLEVDTGMFYYFDGEEWQEIPCPCNGGGGDFTTCDAVITNGAGSAIPVLVAAIVNGELISSFDVADSATETVTTVLYKGTQVVWSGNADVTEVTGDAEIDDGMAIVSGDCTIKFE